MSRYIHSLVPEDPVRRYEGALSALRASDRTYIAHLDSGIAAHPALGYANGRFPDNILVHRGGNTFDPPGFNATPITSLTRSDTFAAGLVEYPDHGVKTLAVILSETGDPVRGVGLNGIAPGVKVVPFRVSNGPLFRNVDSDRPEGPITPPEGATSTLGRAIDLALDIPQVRVISISMGNPGSQGPLNGILGLFGFRSGMDDLTERAIDRAYRNGVIIVASAGQIIRSVVYPALYAQTIAVGGFDREGGTFRHYPRWPYQPEKTIDVWAQAERINRAGYAYGSGAPVPIFANDPTNAEAEPSGTSYATPQVSAAAALWVEKYHDALERDFGSQRWKIVESFRAALRSSASPAHARLTFSEEVPIRALDVSSLLNTPPSAVEIAPAALGSI